MGFPPKWCDWIAECLQTSRVSVLVNGSPTEEFSVSKGLRQGDPLAPFLFLIVAEGLNGLFKKASQLGTFTGYEVGRNQQVDVLQYADDTIILAKAKESNIWAIKSILRLFELASRLKINFLKSQLLGFHVDTLWLQSMAMFLHCRIGSLPFTYLGLPIGANPKRLDTWQPVIEKIQKRLSSWKCDSMSFGGRITLLKSVLHSIPIYFLSFFKAPRGIISQLESLFKSFLWGGDADHKKIHWVAWDDVCREKNKGGLGIRDLIAFNLALLGKWKWRMLVETNSLWVKVINSLYGDHLSFSSGSRVKGSRWCRKVVGNGKNTYFWEEDWLQGGRLSQRYNRLYLIAENKKAKISDLLVWRNGGPEWCWRWRRELFQWEEDLLNSITTEISELNLKVEVEDRWSWTVDPNGIYSIKSAYKEIRNERIFASDKIFSKV
uniref:Ribonuclease H protein At1g65750 family n=1 Tax=Cajanus cajan TaxID=3821 RepID=A0A151RYT3_CAJCA|nr:Putative ribonuclease H protein At1g65750 family [Cajanus cajan]